MKVIKAPRSSEILEETDSASIVRITHIGGFVLLEVGSPDEHKHSISARNFPASVPHALAVGR